MSNLGSSLWKCFLDGMNEDFGEFLSQERNTCSQRYGGVSFTSLEELILSLNSLLDCLAILNILLAPHNNRYVTMIKPHRLIVYYRQNISSFIHDVYFCKDANCSSASWVYLFSQSQSFTIRKIIICWNDTSDQSTFL